MRNVDKIKSLEYELGRRDKKIADQAAIIKRQNKMLENATAGLGELRAATDAILAQAAIACGEKVKDEETGKDLGYRLNIPNVPVHETLAKYEVKARGDREHGLYVIGVVPKETEPDAG